VGENAVYALSWSPYVVVNVLLIGTPIYTIFDDIDMRGFVNRIVGLYVKVSVDDAVSVAPDALTPVVLITTGTMLDVTLLVVGVPEMVITVPRGTFEPVDE